jgi:hypothetical protein
MLLVILLRRIYGRTIALQILLKGKGRGESREVPYSTSGCG